MNGPFWKSGVYFIILFAPKPVPLSFPFLVPLTQSRWVIATTHIYHLQMKGPLQLELEKGEGTGAKHFDERFDYFSHWSQEMFHNDTLLVLVVLCKDLTEASIIWNEQSYTNAYDLFQWISLNLRIVFLIWIFKCWCALKWPLLTQPNVSN